MTASPLDLSAEQWKIVQEILRTHVPSHEVWAFGSRTKGSARRFSDLDLVIITDAPLPFPTRGAIAEDFSESDLPFRVDILDWATTSDAFRRVIRQDRVIIQPKPDDPA